MKFPFFASFIILIILLRLRISRGKKASMRTEDAFWKRELEANGVRRKPLDNLAYITIPLSSLPVAPSLSALKAAAGLQTDSSMCIVEEEEAAYAEICSQLTGLAAQKIVNLSGMTNTDLKLAYGTANLPVLSVYDQNFTTLICLLQRFSVFLRDAQLTDAAVCVLEYAVSIGTDIAASYEDLASLYLTLNRPEQISALREKASALSSSSKGRILSALQRLDVAAIISE